MTLPVNPFLGNISHSKAIVTPAKASRIFSPLVTSGGALSIYGDRGIGKSLLLSYIANPPEEWREEHFQNHIFVFFNCQDNVIPATSGNFWLQVIKQIERKLPDNSIKTKCQALLERATDTEQLSHNDFHDVLDTAEWLQKRIALVLDDFDCMIRTDAESLEHTRAFLQGFRSLTTRDNAANLIVSTRYSLQELCKPLSSPYYSAFENGFTPYRLRCFNEQELVLFLKQIELANQPAFSLLEREYIAYLSGNHPKLVQIAAAEMFNQRIETNAVVRNFVPVGERFRSESRFVFERLWQGTSEIERLLLFLAALQSTQGKAAGAKYDLNDLKAVFQQRERELSELTERGLLKRTQDYPPVWDLFTPIFQWWVMQEITANLPIGELQERRKIWGDLITQRRADQLGNIVDFLKKNAGVLESLARFVLKAVGGEPPAP